MEDQNTPKIFLDLDIAKRRSNKKLTISWKVDHADFIYISVQGGKDRITFSAEGKQLKTLTFKSKNKQISILK